MQVLLDWLRRIVQVGVLNFLLSVGWRIWAGILLGIVGLVGLVVVLILIIVALL